MKNLKNSRKAISPVIATLLLIAISVAAAVITYSWVMNMVGTQQRQSGTMIRIDLVEFKKTGDVKDTVEISVRNTGSVDAVIATIYLTDISGAKYLVDFTEENVVLAGKTLKFTIVAGDGGIPGDWVWKVSSTYNIRLITDNGFPVEAPYSSPSA